MPCENPEGLQLQMDTVSPLVDYLAKGYTVAFMGRELQKENSCFKIKLKTKSGIEVLYWLDTVSYLVNQSSVMYNGNDKKEITKMYTNYMEIEGIKFAQTYITNEFDGSGFQQGKQISIEKIRLNPTVEPTKYQPL